MQIIIADDEVAVRTVLTHHIKVYNPDLYTILYAENGEKLMNLVEHHEPQILFVDVKMPELSGLEALEALEEQNLLGDVSLYIISGYTDFNYARQAMKLGAKDFLPKPIRYTDIEGILRQEEIARFPGVSRDAILSLKTEEKIESYLGVLTDMEESVHNYDLQLFKESVAAWEKWGFPLEESFFRRLFGKDSSTKEEQKTVIENYVGSLSDSPAKSKTSHAIISYIGEHYQEPDFCMGVMTEKFQYSAQYISKVCRKASGQNFSLYVTSLRIEKAKELLLKDDVRVNAVAWEVGYTYPSYFVKVFSQKMGMTPSEWRRQETIGS